MKKRALIFISVVICSLVIAGVALAMDNPTTIWFGTKAPIKYVRVFENVNETGDMLFLAEGYVNYATDNTDNYLASEAFIFQIRSTDNSTVLLARPLESYGERPISIYQTAAQVTTENLTSGLAYVARITGNPALFPSLVEGTNMISYSLGLLDWIDQSLATEEYNPLKDACIYIAENMEEEDLVAAGTYVIQSEGESYLTPTGGTLFLTGVPSLNIFVPSLFQITTYVMTAEQPGATGNYKGNLTPLLKLGPTISAGLSNVGEYFGVSETMAATTLLIALIAMLSIYLYKKTQSGKVVLALGVAAVLPVGAFLGLTTLVLMLILVIVIALLFAYYFLTRGAL